MNQKRCMLLAGLSGQPTFATLKRTSRGPCEIWDMNLNTASNRAYGSPSNGTGSTRRNGKSEHSGSKQPYPSR